jgi:hypothetical protein
MLEEPEVRLGTEGLLVQVLNPTAITGPSVVMGSLELGIETCPSPMYWGAGGNSPHTLLNLSASESSLLGLLGTIAGDGSPGVRAASGEGLGESLAAVASGDGSLVVSGERMSAVEGAAARVTLAEPKPWSREWQATGKSKQSVEANQPRRIQ